MEKQIKDSEMNRPRWQRLSSRNKQRRGVPSCLGSWKAGELAPRQASAANRSSKTWLTGVLAVHGCFFFFSFFLFFLGFWNTLPFTIHHSPFTIHPISIQRPSSSVVLHYLSLLIRTWPTKSSVLQICTSCAKRIIA